jgi:hypothetical protein
MIAIKKLAATVALGALLMPCVAASSPYPSGTDFEAAIASIAPMVARQAAIRLVAVEAQATEDVGLMDSRIRRHICRITYTTHPGSEIVRQFFASVSRRDATAWLRSLAVHEAMHCVQIERGFWKGQLDTLVPPEYAALVTSTDAFLREQRRVPVVRWGEAASDIAALLYLKRTAPARWKPLARRLARIRRERRKFDPEHDTSAWIAALLRQNSDSSPIEAPLFERALLLRSALRPG